MISSTYESKLKENATKSFHKWVAKQIEKVLEPQLRVLRVDLNNLDEDLGNLFDAYFNEREKGGEES